MGCYGSAPNLGANAPKLGTTAKVVWADTLESDSGVYTDAERDADCYQDTNDYTDTNDHANANANVDAERDADAKRDAHGHQDTDSYRDTDGNAARSGIAATSEDDAGLDAVGSNAAACNDRGESL